MSPSWPGGILREMERFYWLINEVLAGCGRPGGSGRGEPDPDQVDNDLSWLERQGIGALLTLTEVPLPASALERHSLQVLHLPVPDLEAPSPDAFLQALDFIDRQQSQGKAVAVHCLVGQGRTATVLAGYLIRSGVAPDEAITRLRLLCPGAIGSEAQERALEAFARRADWMI